MKKIINFLTLFTSSSTLICCALPSLLVALGAGGVLASLVGHFPALVWISVHKIPVFIFAGIMLTIGGFLQYNAKDMMCPIDQEQAQACGTSRKWGLRIYLFSLVMFVCGGFFAFVAPHLL